MLLSGVKYIIPLCFSVQATLRSQRIPPSAREPIYHPEEHVGDIFQLDEEIIPRRQKAACSNVDVWSCLESSENQRKRPESSSKLSLYRSWVKHTLHRLIEKLSELTSDESYRPSYPVIPALTEYVYRDLEAVASVEPLCFDPLKTLGYLHGEHEHRAPTTEDLATALQALVDIWKTYT